MEVVLRQDVDHVGLRGEVVNVARGYARNYLLPRGLAEVATPGLKRELERRDALKARTRRRRPTRREAIAKRLEATELRFEVNAGPTGSLFGSVTATNVVDRLWEEQKIRIDRRKLGHARRSSASAATRSTVEVFTDVTAELRLIVVPEGGELPPRGAGGRPRRPPPRQQPQRRPRLLAARARSRTRPSSASRGRGCGRAEPRGAGAAAEAEARGRAREPRRARRARGTERPEAETSTGRRNARARTPVSHSGRSPQPVAACGFAAGYPQPVDELSTALLHSSSTALWISPGTSRSERGFRPPCRPPDLRTYVL